ncbi:putative NADPH dependent F420 reductase [Azoarcus sp. CIB]|uniref:NADPH-dependent F420 reductase n=1 Tax=Aromatoleum sp. (strain CIB) TaxID=198107 RepID=UPI0006A27A64|nr:NADPH-dependent F420 reductase [Azoarcus sp. CIB]AKU11385.1 putative NADPH dependent F420 reductase [Azoarcus sp. CIB]
MTNGTERIIGVVGGTGHLGAALARRWAKHGHKVVIGSRDADKARAAADVLGAELGREIASGTNLDAARRADIVVVTVPFSSQAAVLEEIRPAVGGKIVVDTTVPLVPPKVMRVQLPPEGCAALRAQALLGEGVRVVSAFHNVAAHKLATDVEVECDVLVCWSSATTRRRAAWSRRSRTTRACAGSMPGRWTTPQPPRP